MKRFASLLSIFLFMLLMSNTIDASAESKILTQGIYSVKDLQLSTNVSYNIRNLSPTNKSLLLVIDSNQIIQEMLRLEPNSQKYILKPLNFGDIIIVIGAANLEFS